VSKRAQIRQLETRVAVLERIIERYREVWERLWRSARHGIR